MAGIMGYLLIGFICMVLLSLIRNRYYNLKIWEIVVFMLLLVITGVIGTAVLFYIENGHWGGTSFFGSIFLIPIVFTIIGKTFKITYGKMMDICAVPICAMLAVMKVRCFLEGCCDGIIIKLADDVSFTFPSQMAEMIVILIIMIKLIIWEVKGINKNILYPLFLIMYGVTRFVLNFFRADLSPFVLILPPGHFWSIVAVVCGIIVIFWSFRKKETEEDNLYIK